MTDPFAPPSGDPPLVPPVYGSPQPPPPYAPPPAYGAPPPPYGAPLAAQAKNGFGVTSLVLGVLAILSSIVVVGAVFGVVGIVFGLLGRGRAKRREANNGGVALAGLICSTIGLLLGATALGLLIALFSSDSGQRYLDCVDAAGNDTAASQACSDQLRRDLLGN